MSSSILALDRVHARDAGGPRGRARGGLSGVTLALGPGVHAFLGAPEDGALALAELLAGARSPLRGRVTVAGRDPARTPFLRARIGALAAEPRLPAAPTVRAAVRLAMRARGETGERCDAVLDRFGLSRVSAREPRSLAFAEQRAVELALALSTPAPVLLTLHEPLADLALPGLELLFIRLREAAAAGACVVVTTSSPADARALADHVLVLHRGLVAREAMLQSGHLRAGLVLDEGIRLRALVRAGARELAAALASRPEVRAVSWREMDDSSALVELRGDHAEACALALIDAALTAGVEIEALSEAAPDLGEVRNATETLWKMMRDRPPATSLPAAPPAPLPAPDPSWTTASPPAVPVEPALDPGADP
jgi:ABC-2 type transport system ATP-binding protein